MKRTARLSDVRRELARAHGARRVLPWAIASAAGGAAIAAVAGGGVRAALAVLGIGLVFAAFTWIASIPRCPACGSSIRALEKRPGPAESPGPAEAERDRRCPRCRALFD